MPHRGAASESDTRHVTIAVPAGSSDSGSPSPSVAGARKRGGGGGGAHVSASSIDTPLPSKQHARSLSSFFSMAGGGSGGGAGGSADPASTGAGVGAAGRGNAPRAAVPPVYLPRADAILLHRQLQLYHRDHSTAAHYGHVPHLPLPHPSLVLEDTAADFAKTQKQSPFFLWQLFEFLRLPKPAQDDTAMAAASASASAAASTAASHAPTSATAASKKLASKQSNAGSAAMLAMVLAQDEELARAGLLEKARTNGMPLPPLPPGAGKAAHAAAAQAALDRARPLALEEIRPLTLPDHVRADAAVWPPPPSGPPSLYSPPAPLSLLDAAIPHTVVYEDGQILHWFFSSAGKPAAPGAAAADGDDDDSAPGVPANTILRKKRRNCTPANVARTFLSTPASKRITPWCSSRDLDIVATFYPKSVSELHVVVPLFLSREQLERFVKERAQRMRISGVLQAFVAPMGSHNTLLRVEWTPVETKVLERVAGLPVEHPASRGKGNDVDSRITTFERNWQAPLAEGALVIDPNWSELERRQHEEAYLDSMLAGNLIGGSEAAGMRNKSALHHHPHKITLAPAPPTIAPLIPASLLFVAPPAEKSALPSASAPDALDKEEKEAALIKDPTAAAAAAAAATIAAASAPVALQTTLAYNEHRIQQVECLDQSLVSTLNSYAWLIALHLKAVLVRHQKGVANPGVEAVQPLLPVKLVLYFKRGSGGKLFLLFMDEFLAAGGNVKLLSKFEAVINDPLRDAILLSNNTKTFTAAGVGTIKALAGKVGAIGSGSASAGANDSGAVGTSDKSRPAHSSDSDDDGSSPLSSAAQSRHGSAPRSHPSKKLTLASDSAADSALAASKRSFTVSATSLRRAPFNASSMGLREWMRYCWSWRVGEYEWNRSLGIMELHREMRRESRKANVEANNAAQALALAFPAGGKAAPRESAWSSGKSCFARAKAVNPSTFVPVTRPDRALAATAVNNLSRSRRTASQHSINLSRLASMDFSDVPAEERPGSCHSCAHCHADFALGPEAVLADQKLSLFVVLPRLVASALGLGLQAPGEEGGAAAAGSKSTGASGKKAHAVVDSGIWCRVLMSFFPALTEPKVRQLLRDQSWMESTLVPLCEICMNEVRGVPVISDEFEGSGGGGGGGNGPASPTTAASNKQHASSAPAVRGPVHDLTDATLAELDISLREYLGLPLHMPILLTNDETQQPQQQGEAGSGGHDATNAHTGDNSFSATESAPSDSTAPASLAETLTESELQAQARKERKAAKRAAKRQAEEATARAARHARIEAEALRWRAKALGQPLPPTDTINLLDERVPLEPVDPISATLDPSHDPAKLLNPDLDSSPLFASIASGSGGSVSAVQAHAQFVARGGGTLHPPPPHPVMRSMRAANKRAAAAAAAAAAAQDNSDDDEPAQPHEPSLAAYHREQEWLRQLTAAALAEGDIPQPSSPTSSMGGTAGDHSGDAHRSSSSGGGGVAASWSFLRNSRARAREAYARTSQRREREWRQADEAAQREHEAKMKLEGTPELRHARAQRFCMQREQQRIWRAAAMEAAQEQAEAEMEAQSAEARLAAHAAELAARKASRSALERIPFPVLAAAGPQPNFPAPETVAQYVKAQGLPDSYTVAYERAYDMFLKDVAEQAEKDRRALEKKQHRGKQRGMKGSASAPALPPITTVYAPGSSHPQSSAASAAVAAAAAKRVQRRPWDDRPAQGASRSSPLVDASQLPATHANRWDSAHSRPSTSLNTLAPRGVVDPQKRSLIRGGGGRVKDEFDEIVDRVAELKAKQAEQAEAEAAAAARAGATNRERSRSPMRSNSPLRSSSPLRSAAPPVPSSHSTLSAYVPTRSASHSVLPTVREGRSGANSLGATTSSFGDSPSRVPSAQRLRPQGSRRVGFEGGAESGEASDDDGTTAPVPRGPQGLAYANELKAWWASSHRAAEKSDRLRQNAKYSLDKYRDEREARVQAKLAMQMMDQKEEAWRREQAADAVASAQMPAAAAASRRSGGGASRLHPDAIEEEKDSSALSTAPPSRKHSSRSTKSNHSSGRRAAAAGASAAGNSSDRSTTSTGSEPLLPRSSVAALKELHQRHLQEHGAHCNCLELLSLVERGGRSGQPKHARQPTSVARQKLDEWLQQHEAEAATLAQIEEQQQQQQQKEAATGSKTDPAAALASVTVTPAATASPLSAATPAPALSAHDAELASATSTLLSLFHSAACPCFAPLLAKVDASFVAELVRLTSAMVSPREDAQSKQQQQSLHDRTMALLASISTASASATQYGERELLDAVKEKVRVFSIVHELDHDAPAPPSMAVQATPVFPVPKLPLCNLCDDETATVQCTDCEEPYCDSCNADFHKPAKNASHARLPLVVV